MTKPEKDEAERLTNTPVDLRSQFRGARVVSHFYPVHWARVQLARATRDAWNVTPTSLPSSYEQTPPTA